MFMIYLLLKNILKIFFIINKNKQHVLLADKAYTSKDVRTNLSLFNCSIMVPKKKVLVDKN